MRAPVSRRDGIGASLAILNVPLIVVLGHDSCGAVGATLSALDPDRLSDIDGAMADAVALKFLEAPLTKEQLAEFFQIPKK